MCLNDAGEMINSFWASRENVFIHQSAVVGSDVIFGVGTKVWSGAVIGDGVKTGQNCCIGSNCYVGRGTVMGDNCRMQHGSFLPNNSRLGNNVFIGPNATFTDDKYPRVGNHNYLAEPPTLGDDSAIGAGAVILPGVTIGPRAMVGAGAVVTGDVLTDTTVIGCPADILVHMEGHDA